MKDDLFEVDDTAFPNVSPDKLLNVRSCDIVYEFAEQGHKNSFD